MNQYFALIKEIDTPFSSKKESLRGKKARTLKVRGREELPQWRQVALMEEGEDKVLHDQDGVVIDDGQYEKDEQEKELHEAAKKREKNAKWMGKAKHGRWAGL